MSVAKNFVKTKIKSSKYLLYVIERRNKRKCEKSVMSLSDEDFIRQAYKKQNGKDINLTEPRAFTEKLQWLKLYYRNELMSICSDKYTLKEFLAQKGLSELAVPTLGVYNSVEDIDISKLPKSFIMKATHGSGWNIICTDKDKHNWRITKKLLRLWLSCNLYSHGREWNYKEQTPKIIIEPLLTDSKLVDYKIMCFNGKARAIQVNHDQNRIHYVDIYDTDWNLYKDFSIGIYPHSTYEIEKPDGLERMKEIAEKLAESFPFVRVDFYNFSNKLYIGEMTFFPGNGFWKIEPDSRDVMLGDWLVLPK